MFSGFRENKGLCGLLSLLGSQNLPQVDIAWEWGKGDQGGSRGSETPAFHTLHFRLPPFFP